MNKQIDKQWANRQWEQGGAQAKSIEFKDRWWFLMAIAALLAALMMTMTFVTRSAVALAQAENVTAIPAEEAAPAASAANEVSPDDVNTVAHDLWCPLCSGVRLDACELKACTQMKDVIAIKLAEGEDSESIQAYFVEQYGPQVMGEPPRAGFNWLAWILPAVAVVVGGYFFWRNTQRMMTPAPSLPNIPLPEGSTSGASARLASTFATPASQQEAAEKAKEKAEEDEYTQKLEEELSKYG